MKAIVTKPFKGVPDGELYGRDFGEGDTVLGNLAEVAVREGWAREVDVPGELPLGQKDQGDAPENKAEGNAPQNKRKK